MSALHPVRGGFSSRMATKGPLWPWCDHSDALVTMFTFVQQNSDPWPVPRDIAAPSWRCVTRCDSLRSSLAT